MNERDRRASIQKQIGGMPHAYLACRTFGHRWDDPEVKVQDTDLVRVSVVCNQCGAESWREITLRGSVQARGIAYPNGYLLHNTGMLSTTDRNVVRAGYLHRILEGDLP